MLVVRSLVRRGPFLIHRGAENFYQRILGHYGLLIQDVTPEALIFLAAAWFEEFELFKRDGGDKGAVYQNVYVDYKIQWDTLNQFLNRVLLYRTGRITWQDQVYLSVMPHHQGIRNTQEFLTVLKRAAGQKAGRTEAPSVYGRLQAAEIYRDVLRSRTIGYENRVGPIPGELLLPAYRKTSEWIKSIAGTGAIDKFRFRSFDAETVKEFRKSAADYIKPQYRNSDREIWKGKSIDHGKWHQLPDDGISGKVGMGAVQPEYGPSLSEHIEAGVVTAETGDPAAVSEKAAKEYLKSYHKKISGEYPGTDYETAGKDRLILHREITDKEYRKSVNKFVGKWYGSLYRPIPGDKKQNSGKKSDDLYVSKETQLTGREDGLILPQSADLIYFPEGREVTAIGRNVSVRAWSKAPAVSYVFQPGDLPPDNTVSDLEKSVWDRLAVCSFIWKSKKVLQDLYDEIRGQDHLKKSRLNPSVWLEKCADRQSVLRRWSAPERERTITHWSGRHFRKLQSGRSDLTLRIMQAEWKKRFEGFDRICFQGLAQHMSSNRDTFCIRDMFCNRDTFCNRDPFCNKDPFCNSNLFREPIRFASLLLQKEKMKILCSAASPYLERKTERWLSKGQKSHFKAYVKRHEKFYSISRWEYEHMLKTADVRSAHRQTDAFRRDAILKHLIKQGKVQGEVQSISFTHLFRDAGAGAKDVGAGLHRVCDSLTERLMVQKTEIFRKHHVDLPISIIRLVRYQLKSGKTGAQAGQLQAETVLQDGRKGSIQSFTWPVKPMERMWKSVSFQYLPERLPAAHTTPGKNRKTGQENNTILHSLFINKVPIMEICRKEGTELQSFYHPAVSGEALKNKSEENTLLPAKVSANTAEFNISEDIIPQRIRKLQVREPRLKAPRLTELQLREPQLKAPQMTEQQQKAPQLTEPQLREPQLKAPQMTEPQLREPQLKAPRMTELQLREPQLKALRITELQLRGPQLKAPQLTEPQLRKPQLKALQLTEPQQKALRMTELQLREPQQKAARITELQLREPHRKAPQMTELQLRKPHRKAPQLTELQLREPHRIAPQIKELPAEERQPKEWQMKELQAKELELKEQQIKELRTKELKVEDQEVRRMVQINVQEQVERLTDQVYRRLERRLLSEKKRRGL